MFRKELASIEKFGFVDPVTVRHLGEDLYEIIDGEHRWRAAQELGLAEIPVFDVGPIDDAKAKQLTIVLNETRGQSDEQKLGDLLKDLLSSETTASLMETLPFSQEKFDELTRKPDFDWGSFEHKVDPQDKQAQWVERIYRLPLDAAEVLDRALKTAKEGEDMTDAQALELIAADFLGGH